MHDTGRDRNARCAYTPGIIYWPRFVSDLRSGLAYDLQRDLALWPFLFIDEVGAERDASGFAWENLYMILGQRVGKWTFLTSNLDMEAIAKADRRIASRLTRDGSRVCTVSAPDWACRRL